MVKRTFQRFDAGIKATVKQAEHLLVLVHGFNFRGNTGRDRSQTYWAQFGALILDEPALATTDIVFFDYPSNSSLIPRRTSLIGGSLECAPIPEVVALLRSTIRERLHSIPSSSYSVLGHSLGAHIALMAVSEFVGIHRGPPPKSVNLLAAPNHPSWPARLHKYFSFGRNPQTRFLGSKNALEENLDDRLAEIAEFREQEGHDIAVRHLHSMGDPFVRYDPASKYDDSEICHLQHTMFDSIKTSTNKQYKLIVSWVKPL